MVMLGILESARRSENMKTFVDNNKKQLQDALTPHVIMAKWRNVAIAYWMVAHEEEDVFMMQDTPSEHFEGLKAAARVLITRMETMELDHELEPLLLDFDERFEQWSNEYKQVLIERIGQAVRALWTLYPSMTSEMKAQVRRTLDRQLQHYDALAGEQATNQFVSSMMRGQSV